MRKKTKSKLDPYAEQLAAMEAETPRKTLPQMQDWLKGKGVEAAPNTIGRYLQSQRAAEAQDRFLCLVANGSAQCQEMDEAFAKNPAPALESLIRLFKVLVFQLTVKGAAAPEALALANRLTVTVCNFFSDQTAAAFKERALAIEEQKFAEMKKSEQAKALESCLEEAGKFPAVMDLFRQAFGALEKAKNGGTHPSAATTP